VNKTNNKKLNPVASLQVTQKVFGLRR